MESAIDCASVDARSYASRSVISCRAASSGRVAPGFLSTILMMWYPNGDFTRSLICPGCRLKAASSNSFTMRPRPK